LDVAHVTGQEGKRQSLFPNKGGTTIFVLFSDSWFLICLYNKGDIMKLKDTLNLGKTEFPMRAGLPTKEPLWQKEWDEAKLYQRRQELNQGKPHFTLHDGPPYANGNIHVGHAMNKISKDIIVRSKSMSGFYAPSSERQSRKGCMSLSLHNVTSCMKRGATGKALSPRIKTETNVLLLPNP